MTNKKQLLLFPVISASLLLAGCATDSKKTVDLNLRYMTADSAPVDSTDASAQAQLSEAAGSVGQSLKQLSAIQIATHPGVPLPSQASAPVEGLTQRASLNWTGPVEGVVQKIAHCSGFSVQILGDTPAIVPMVVLYAKNQTLATILRNVQYQVAGKADIRVYPDTREIELRYRPNS